MWTLAIIDAPIKTIRTLLSHVEDYFLNNFDVQMAEFLLIDPFPLYKLHHKNKEVSWSVAPNYFLLMVIISTFWEETQKIVVLNFCFRSTLTIGSIYWRKATNHLLIISIFGFGRGSNDERISTMYQRIYHKNFWQESGCEWAERYLSARVGWRLSSALWYKAFGSLLLNGWLNEVNTQKKHFRWV